jgi:hypothetical protein
MTSGSFHEIPNSNAKPKLFRGKWICRACLELVDDCTCKPDQGLSEEEQFWQDEAKVEYDHMAEAGRQEITDYNTGIIR